MKNSIILGLALSVCIGLNNTAEAGLIGNDVIDRERNDTWTNFTTIDKSLKFTESGVITDWSIWSGGAGDIFLQVFRHVSDDTYTIVGENYFNNVTEGFNTWSVEATQQIDAFFEEVGRVSPVFAYTNQSNGMLVQCSSDVYPVNQCRPIIWIVMLPFECQQGYLLYKQHCML